MANGMKATLNEAGPFHGISSGTYLNGPYGFRPSLECLCGQCWVGDSWAEVGEELDIHLEEVGAPPCGKAGLCK